MSMSREHEFVRLSSNVWYYIDGMTTTPHSPTDWYWTNSGNKVSFPMQWAFGQPDFAGDEYCLSIVPSEGFNDIACNSSVFSFFCHRLDYFSQARDN